MLKAYTVAKSAARHELEFFNSMMERKMKHKKVSTLADLNILDSEQITQGYLYGLEQNSIEPVYASRAFWHGWRNARIDRGFLPADKESANLAHEYFFSTHVDCIISICAHTEELKPGEPQESTKQYGSRTENSTQEKLMKYDPTSGEENPYPSYAKHYRDYHGQNVAWLFNPWTGTRRNAQDVGSDLTGLLIL